MPERIVSLPPDLEDFVRSNVESGRFESTTELMRAAILALNREQKAAGGDVRVACTPDSATASAIAEGDVFRKLWEASPESSFLATRR
ncbi:MAG: hypothetical protein ABSG51_13380 [Terracidiphilus sp.]